MHELLESDLGPLVLVHAHQAVHLEQVLAHDREVVVLGGVEGVVALARAPDDRDAIELVAGVRVAVEGDVLLDQRIHRTPRGRTGAGRGTPAHGRWR